MFIRLVGVFEVRNDAGQDCTPRGAKARAPPWKSRLPKRTTGPAAQGGAPDAEGRELAPGGIDVRPPEDRPGATEDLGPAALPRMRSKRAWIAGSVAASW